VQGEKEQRQVENNGIGIRRRPVAQDQLERSIHSLLEENKNLGHHEIRNILRHKLGYGFGNDQFCNAVRKVKSIMGLRFRAPYKKRPAVTQPTLPIMEEKAIPLRVPDIGAWVKLGEEIIGTRFTVVVEGDGYRVHINSHTDNEPI
jgi:hypothetical protein